MKRDAGFNKRQTLSFSSVIAALTVICFFIGIPDLRALLVVLTSAEFWYLALKSSFVLLPLHGLYVILCSATRPWFKILHASAVMVFMLSILAVDVAFDHAVLDWWVGDAATQRVLLAIVAVLFAGIFEVRIGSRWYSLFYNQRGKRVGMGWLTILSENGPIVSIVGVNSFTGRLP